MQRPPEAQHDRRAEQDERQRDLEPRGLDRERAGRALLLPAPCGAEAETPRVPPVVGVHEAACREGGERAAGAAGDEAEADFERVVAVARGQLRGEGGHDGVVAGEEEAGGDEDEAGFFLEEQREGLERVREAQAVRRDGWRRGGFG